MLDLIARQLNFARTRQGLLHVAGERRAFARLRGSIPGPDERSAEGHRPPFVGEWMVSNGGVTSETSHSWSIANQRYALDFLIVDESGSSHRGAGKRLHDYYAFGAPVVCSKDGIVIQAIDGRNDYGKPG